MSAVRSGQGLGTNAAQLARLDAVQLLKNIRDQGTQVRHTIRPRMNQNHAHPYSAEILLMGEPLIHCQERLKLATGTAQKLTIGKPSPSVPAHCPDNVAQKLARQVVGYGLIK